MPQAVSPESLPAEARFHELTKILATGILRLRQRAALAQPTEEQQTPAELRPPHLEVPAKTVLSVTTG